MAYLTLSLFGAPKVLLGQKAISHFRSAKTQGLLAYLAIEAQRAHAREALLALFWPEEAQETAQLNLRQSLFRLRQLLGDDTKETRQPPYLLVDRQTVQFNPASDYELDVAEFRTHLAAGRSAQAVEVYQGELLAGFSCESAAFDEWLFFTREALQLQALEALSRLNQTAMEQGKAGDAIQYARRQLALEPWRETAHQQVMLALAAAGEHSKALAHYETCRATLWQELQVEPSAETVALAEKIRTGEIDREQKQTGKQGRQGDKENDPEAGTTWVPSTTVSLSPAISLSSLSGSSLSPPLIDWGEAPDVYAFYGRQTELADFERWLVGDRCRLIAVLGMGGIGKTTLTARLARQVADQFDFVIWRSLLNAPVLADILRGWVQFLSGQQLAHWPIALDAQLALLFAQLRQYRCLLVLDNVESILQSADRAGAYRPGYEEYGQLFTRLGESSHQSCLVATSREQPQEVARLASGSPLVRTLVLPGLATQDGRQLMRARGLAATDTSTAALVERCSGNPLALNLVAETILDFFEGDIETFLRDETLIFDDIRAVLDQHFTRLTPLERTIILWLAIEREACTLQTLHNNLWPLPTKRDLLEALRSLQQRSLLDKTSSGLTLQNVVMEYATNYLIDQVSQEIATANPLLLKSHTLLKAQGKEYVRQSQQRLILQPLRERLLADLGQTRLETQLKAILDLVRTTPAPGQDYTGGNLVNLLLYLGFDVRGYDFSRLSIRQAYLQGARLPGVNFAHTQWVEPVFTNTFGNVTTIAFSRDGQHLAAGSSDGAIRLWRVNDGQLTMTLVGHERFVWALAFSPDQQWLASGSADQTVRIWAVEHGQLLHTLHGHADAIYTVAFHPSGELLASSGVGDAIRLWNVRAGTLHRLLPHPHAQVDSLAFDPTGHFLAGAGQDLFVQLWEVASGEVVGSFVGHEGWLRQIDFSSDGVWLAASCYDHTIRIWNVHTGELRTTLRAHAAEVGSLTYSPNGRWLASGSWDKTVRLWDVQSEQTIQTLYGHNDWITDLAFSPDGALLASSSWDKSIRLWDVGNLQGGTLGAARHTLIGFVSSIYILAFSGNGTLLASGGEDQLVRLWEMRSGQTVRTFEGHTAPIYALAFHPQQMLLASGGNDQIIHLWDIQTGKPSQLLYGHTNSIKSLAFSPRTVDNLLASASKDQTVRLWDMQSRRTVRILHGHTGAVAAVAFHPDGGLLASGSYDQTVRLWDVASGQTRAHLVGHTGWIYAVAFSPDGKTLASASYDKTIRLWDVETGELRNTLQGHTDYVYAVAFSPDGEALASGSTDQTVRIWDAQTGMLCHTLTGHTNWVWSLAFSPTEGVLASGSVDETIKLWDWSSGICQHTLRPDGPYAGMDITGATGITAAQRTALLTLGAIDLAFP